MGNKIPPFRRVVLGDPEAAVFSLSQLGLSAAAPQTSE